MAALKEGLEECVKLLAPVEPGSTLVLSSLRSESVKGYVTRIGTKIVKGVCSHPVFTPLVAVVLSSLRKRQADILPCTLGHSAKVFNHSTEYDAYGCELDPLYKTDVQTVSGTARACPSSATCCPLAH